MVLDRFPVAAYCRLGSCVGVVVVVCLVGLCYIGFLVVYVHCMYLFRCSMCFDILCVNSVGIGYSWFMCS